MKVADAIKSINTKDKNKAILLPVRELEQESKGHYVAFVDDGEQSYDVQLTVQASKITTFSCDCPSEEPMCLHKIAVLLAMQESKGTTKITTTTVKAKGKKKKLTETEEVMLTLEKEAITSWLSEVFKKNKPLEQLFLLTFSTEEKTFTTSQVQDIMEQTIKSVAGRRKTLEGANVKKLMDLMAIALDPVNQFTTVSINKPIAHDIFATVIETMNAFERRIRTYSKKIEGFYEGYINWFALTINNIQSKPLWEEVVKQYVYITFKHVLVKDAKARTYNDSLVKEVYYTGTREQKMFIATELVHSLKSMPIKRTDLDFTYVLFLKEIALDHNLYDLVSDFFVINVFKN